VWAGDFVATFRIAGEILASALERKRADEALRASLQASADIVQAIPSGLFIYRYEPPDRLVLASANPAAERQRVVASRYGGAGSSTSCGRRERMRNHPGVSARHGNRRAVRHEMLHYRMTG